MSQGARNIISTKENIRLLDTKKLGDLDSGSKILSVSGGLLIQDNDIAGLSREDLKIVSTRLPTDEEINNCLFAWKVCKYVKSNAIVYTRNNQTIGIGAVSYTHLTLPTKA